jgi:hypothetical protein
MNDPTPVSTFCYDRVSHPLKRLDNFSKRCYHHSLVVIDQKPTPQLLKEYLFHLRRAYGQRNRPPPNADGEKNLTDRILQPRRNR